MSHKAQTLQSGVFPLYEPLRPVLFASVNRIDSGYVLEDAENSIYVEYKHDMPLFAFEKVAGDIAAALGCDHRVVWIDKDVVSESEVVDGRRNRKRNRNRKDTANAHHDQPRED